MYCQIVNYALHATKNYIYLIFKVLQMTLYSIILKAFDSYMENFYRTPSFECTYLKIYIHICEKNYEAYQTSHVQTYKVPC